MNTLATLILSVVTELSSPDYVIYPIDDIFRTVPQFTDAPYFGLGRWQRNETNSTGYVESENDRIDTIRMLIEEDLRSKGIQASVFFFDGNFIVKYL
jgi:hypothetical protein